MILERSQPLATLASLIDDIETSGGRVVLMRGEAGIGKTALVSRFVADTRERAHVLMGACDDLLTPQPLGPIWDIARQEHSVAEPLGRDDRRAVMEALLDLLSRNLRPTALIIEDTQWAGEATLDVIKFLGRRIARTNGILILTYRDGEVDADHPLRQVIGELPPQNLVRIGLRRLSPRAVASMVDGTDLDLDETLTLTGGNPLFVTEVVASGVDVVPSSVQDAVLARASKVSPQARHVLDLVSVVPGDAELSHIDAILHPTGDQLHECVRQGLLDIDGNTIAFPHELQRRAIESSLTPTDRRRLNVLIMDALSDDADPSRLVHHAREAEDIGSIVAYAPGAARAASAIRSTREAVAHFRLVEPYLERLPVVEQADILEDWAREEYYLDNAVSLDLLDRAIGTRRAVGDQRRLARTLTFAAGIKRVHLRNTAALDCVVEAVAILERHEPSADLARALSVHAFINWLNYEDIAMGLGIADEAMSVADTTSDEVATIWTLNTKGSISHSGGDAHGIALVEESLRLAQLGGYAYEEVRALINLAGMSGDDREVERATDLARRASDTAARNEMPAFEADARSMYSEFLLWKGTWAEAEDAASECLSSAPATATLAWRVLATLQARRGRSEARFALDRMWMLATTSEQLTIVDPAAAVLAEYVWLSGDADPSWNRQLTDVLDMGLKAGRPWPSGAFAFWMWKLGLLEAAPQGTADFYGWIIAGEYRTAAEFWAAKGAPYEQALALMHGDTTEQIAAVRILERLGATAPANKIRRALFDEGVKVPRGPSRAVREHAAGLTARQAEVLDLLAEGLTNIEIADQLFVSHRTVENHVSAILMKLDVPTRGAAVEAAQDQGFLTTP